MASSDSVPRTISSFHILAISLPTVPSFPKPATHYLYIQPHAPKVPTASSSRSLFLVNIPFDSTPAHLKHLFSTQLGLPAGRISDLTFHDRDEAVRSVGTEIIPLPTLTAEAAKNTSNRKRKRDAEKLANLPPLDPSLPPVWDRELHAPGTNAVLEFVDKASMEAALDAVKQTHTSKSKKKLVWGAGIESKVPSLGSQRYAKHKELLATDRGELMAAVDSYMTAFNAHTAARDRMLAEQRRGPDEDGFVTVGRGSGRAGGVKQEVAKEKLQKQKDKREGLTDFYRFQGRERAKEKAGLLMKKFQEDVEKVQKIRERKGRMRPD